MTQDVGLRQAAEAQPARSCVRLADAEMGKPDLSWPLEPMAKRRPVLQHRGPFASTLFRYQGKGGWVFAPVPKKLAPPVTRPWGRTPVRVVVDGVAWETSIWRDSKSDGALLAVPLRVRGRKGHGDTVTVEFTFDPEDEG